MTPQEFNESWTKSKEPLSPISTFRLDRFKLTKPTFDFLSTAGLPIYAAPDLSFATNTDDIIEGINKLTEQYEFLKDVQAYDRYVVIGSCRDGDAIAIDTDDDDTVVELDHEDLFRPLYFNASIEALAEFLVLYRDFEIEVLEDKNPDDNFQCLNFSDQQFERLRGKMLKADPKALKEKGFWKDELEIMISLREEYYLKR